MKIEIFGQAIELFRVMKTKSKPTQTMLANRHWLNAADCREAEKFLEKYLKLKEMNTKEYNAIFDGAMDGLMVAAIVSYGRAFTSSRGGNDSADIVKANLGDATSNNQEKINLHKLILEKRHKVVAHADSEFRYSRLTDRPSDTMIIRVSNVIDYSQSINPELFLSLAKNMEVYFRITGHEIDNSTDSIPPLQKGDKTS